MGGATHNAVFTEIGNKGHADKFLLDDKNPAEAEATFWRFVHDRHAPFAMEPVDFDATAAQPKFGGNAKFQFPRQGDIAWHTYAKISLPGIVAVKDGKVVKGADAAYWQNAIGFRLLKEVTLAIGNTVIDTLTDTYLYVWNVLSTKAGKECDELVGKFNSIEDQQKFAKRSRLLYVPIPFTHSANSNLALPLCALAFHGTTYDIHYASRFDSIINPSGGQVCVRPNGISDEELDEKLAAGSISLAPLSDSDLSCTLESNFVYLESAERDIFVNNAFQQCVDELQIIPAQAYYAAAGASESTPSVRSNIRLQLNNSVQEYIFVVRTEGRANRNFFDFSGPVDRATGELMDPIRDVTIKFNNTPRVQNRPGLFFRKVQPYQYHSNSNYKDFIYVWSYAKSPESAHPTGGANHSRIDNINMELSLDPRIFSPEYPNAEILVFGRSKNILTYRFGMIHKKLG